MSLDDVHRKLLETMHLSIPERQALPDGRLSFAALVGAAEALLEEEPWLPRGLRGLQGFEGVAIEARGSSYWIHECHEVGVGQFGAVTTVQAGSLAAAVRKLLAANGGAFIDGVPVD